MFEYKNFITLLIKVLFHYYWPRTGRNSMDSIILLTRSDHCADNPFVLNIYFHYFWKLCKALSTAPSPASITQSPKQIYGMDHWEHDPVLSSSPFPFLDQFLNILPEKGGLDRVDCSNIIWFYNAFEILDKTNHSSEQPIQHLSLKAFRWSWKTRWKYLSRHWCRVQFVCLDQIFFEIPLQYKTK